MDHDPCAHQSRQTGEPLLGTAAPRIRAWLLVEVPRGWEPRILDGDDLPDPLLARLRALKKREGVRVGFIRRDHRPDGPYTLLVVRPELDDRRAVELEIERHEDLLALDLDGLVDGTVEPPEGRREAPFALVCTHGKRDRCCAVHGMALYKAVAELAPDRVWQVSHIGGHRFAACVVLMPHGIVLGRVEPDEAAAMLIAHEMGELHDLARYRGRSAWSAPAQAADALLRAELGETGLDAIRLVGERRTGDDAWIVSLRHAPTGRVVDVPVVREVGDVLAPSCGREPEPRMRFRRAP